ncbi:hepatitis A virus cellular receptor 1 homolog isoform X2 [Mixophyes fleayi]|uniref:hepatitis A virus cellular receptor 1 homolog isoform X2 n=1 Tax=Mixophyes fleayi TaxID=3061075 RepID=UPI003F4DB211
MIETYVRVCFCLLLGPGLSAAAEHVTGSVDDNLTLPCSYSVSHGTTTMCWGRGSCPSSKCNNVIIWTDGSRVTWRKSDRYQLLGNISQGDVSLTITGVTKEDEGTYCCRVETPGLGNDLKNDINVKLQEVPQRTTSAPTTRTNDLTFVPGVDDPVSIPSTFSPDTVPFIDNEKQSTDVQESPRDSNGLNFIIAGVVIVIILLVSLLVIVYVYKHKMKNKDKSRNSAVITLEGLGETQRPAEQNIYILE